MMKGKVIRAADLFCGAGGTSTGLIRACQSVGARVDLLAINHWNIAIATHLANHPNVRHLCESLDNVDPRKQVPGGWLNLLVASPECTHHSVARGGKPINDQSRASAWHVLRWCEALRIDSVLIENVKEFRTWGPLGVNGRPLKRRKGETYVAFLKALESLGYRVEARVLNAADYGDPTTRERLFIQARRGRRPITWPEPSHAASSMRDLFGEKAPWRTAREIIDWAIPSKSLRDRKKPLSPKTMARIEMGLKKFCGGAFIVGVGGPSGSAKPKSVDKPFNTVLAENRQALCEPFMVVLRNHAGARSLDEPVPTLAASGQHMGLCEPFVVVFRNRQDVKSIDEPLPTMTTSGANFGLCEPFILGQQSGSVARSVDNPVPTVSTDGAIALVEPFLIHTTHAGGDRSRSIDRPVPTITTAKRGELALVEPFIIKYNSNGKARSIDEPLQTVSTKDRFGLVIPDGMELDIRFRMLQPHELAAAQGFPVDYEFKGTREEVVRQIGNAVPCHMAQALCQALIA